MESCLTDLLSILFQLTSRSSASDHLLAGHDYGQQRGGVGERERERQRDFARQDPVHPADRRRDPHVHRQLDALRLCAAVGGVGLAGRGRQ